MTPSLLISGLVYLIQLIAPMHREYIVVGLLRQVTRGFTYLPICVEKNLKDWPGCSYLVMEITPRVPGDGPIISIG